MSLESSNSKPKNKAEELLANGPDTSQSDTNKAENIPHADKGHYPLDKTHPAYRELIDAFNALDMRNIPLNDPMYSERFNRFLNDNPELAEALPQQMEHLRNLLYKKEGMKKSLDKSGREEEKNEMLVHMQKYLERTKTHVELLSRLLSQRDREGYTELMDFRDLGYMHRNLEDLIDSLNKYELKNAENAFINMSKPFENFGPTATRGSAIRDDEGSLRYVEGALRDIETEIDSFSKIAPQYGEKEFDWVISAAQRVMKNLDLAQRKTSFFARAIATYRR